MLPYHPHHRDYQLPQHYPEEVISSPRVAPTVETRDARQTKEFLIHKGEKEVGPEDLVPLSSPASVCFDKKKEVVKRKQAGLS